MMEKIPARRLQVPAVVNSKQVQSPADSLEIERSGTASEETVGFEGPAQSAVKGTKGSRKRNDQGRLHATRHGVLSRYVFEALRTLGEDVKKFRRLERRFRETLKPEGEIAGMVFDRFFSSYLRCIVAARVEASAFTPSATSSNSSNLLPTLREQNVPTLVSQGAEEEPSIHATLPIDLIRELVLMQRYDRHFSREMFRNLSLLLVLRNGGEDGLQQCILQFLCSTKQPIGG
jgi:hypothetical protein